ncbi:AAA family ATPase [Hydrogenimonas urashimensis]|uniref:AAA family ATPase n=1 Tax=Hydrogenimonas urashimensis TaxID=2740515 RepID=UPI001915E9DE|nr:AAA family ATPase [Hydrogenimonas urashimensis]
MIERFYAKNLLGFKTLDISFEPGLIAITGPSGAGKSVFMQSLLALFGLADVQAELSEVVVSTSVLLDLGSFENGEAEMTLRAVKKGKIRFFLNDLTISKKRLKELMQPLVRHISQRSNNELSSELLLELLDAMAMVEDSGYGERLETFRNLYDDYMKKSHRLEKMRSDENRIKEMIEFAEFEIAKIDETAPRVGEDEELMTIKRKLSKKEKIGEAIARASKVFDAEDAVTEALTMIESDGLVLFNEAMNMLRNEFERAEEMLDELQEIDVEQILNRIEALAELKRRYGSIEEALAYRDEKIRDLEYYRNIDHELEELETEVETLHLALRKEAENISYTRREAAQKVEHFINGYLAQLRMPSLGFKLSEKPLDRLGIDAVDIDLQGSSIQTLSGGEFNRIRLALLLCKSELAGGEGILLIDEIDANVSGDESIAIARLLKTLSKNYQIVAISHQPHLSAAAREHILIKKEESKSVAKVLDKNERVEEISRMIAGEKGMKEARALAQNLLGEFAK